MLRLFGLLATLAVFLGAVLAIDFNAARSEAAAKNQPVPDLETYLSGLRPRLAAKLSSARGADDTPTQSTDLARMLPQPPEGWTVRPAKVEDLKPLLPKKKGALDAELAKLIEAIAKSKGPKGGSAAALAYEKGDRIVIIKASRYPDAALSDPATQKAMQGDLPQGFPRGFLRIRGLDVLESTMPSEMRARLFTADVGGQIRLWALVPERMTEKEILPFFETLDVRAMNAAVRDREAGLGELPVLLLVSELDEDALAAYEADRAARDAERQTRRAEARAAMAETAPVEAPSAEPANVTCKKGAGGIKRCTVDG